MNFNEIKTLKMQVEYCLDNYRSTRNSDIELTIILWRTFYSEFIKYPDGEFRPPVVNLIDLFELPSQDSIKRVRANFQNTEKKYPPTDKEVAVKRGWNEEVWRSSLGYNPELRQINLI